MDKYITVAFAVFSLLAFPLRAYSDDIIFEAENVNEVTYGWEIEKRGGQRALILKEGVGDGIGQKKGHFLGPHNDKRKLKGRYFIYVQKKGFYHVWARMMVNRGHCSNAFLVSFDGGGFKHIGKNWTKKGVYHWVKGSSVFLKKGWHTFVSRTHEDGIAVDQFRLSTRRYNPHGRKHLKSTVIPGRGGAELNMRSVEILPRIPSKVVFPGEELIIDIWLRNNKKAEGSKKVLVLVPEDMSEIGPVTVDFNLKAEDILSHRTLTIPLREKLPRKEFRVLVKWDPNSKEQHIKELLFQHHFNWYFLGPLPFESNLRPEFIGRKIDFSKHYKGKNGKIRWIPFRDRTAFTDTGLLDFGILYSAKMFNAMSEARVWGVTRIHVPETKEYLIKILCDDRLVVWIDDEMIINEYRKGPAIRYPRKVRKKLTKGEHRLLFDLDQHKDSWQAGILFRTAADNISNITGVEHVAGK